MDDPYVTTYRLPHGHRVWPDHDAVFLIGHDERRAVRGALEVEVLKALQAPATGADLGERLSDRLELAQVLLTLQRLAGQGLIEPATQPDTATWSLHGAVTDELRQALGAAGVHLDEHAAQRLLITRDYRDPELQRAVDQAHADGTLAVPCIASGPTVWLGPRLSPGDSPCLACLLWRLRRNHPVETYLERTHGHAVVGPAPFTSTADAHLAAAVVAQRLLRSAELPRRTLIRVDLRSLATSQHHVARRPQCPSCGDPELLSRRARSPLKLRDRRIAFHADGGHRVIRPEQTVSRLMEHVDPITGVLTSVGALEGRDHPLRPTWAATYHIVPAPGLAEPDELFTRVSLGKGRTAAQSRASAICEGIERYAAAWQGDEPTTRATLAELGEQALDPRVLQNFSAVQYEERDPEATDARTSAPVPMSDALAIDWTPAWSLTHKAQRWLPLTWCFPHTPVAPEARVAPHDPNGNAAGNCLEEAILQGFLELVERDAAALWWYNRVQRPAIDLSSFDTDYFAALQTHYEGMGWRLRVLDITTDLQIPAAVALADHRDSGRYVAGFGCHLDATLAVQRALTELNQLFDPSGQQRAPWTRDDIVDTSYLHALPGVRHTRQDLPSHRPERLAEAISLCVQQASRVGLETIVLDYSRPDIEGVHTAKVVVPGLRHFWPRFGPGRLYDAPVAMGWLPHALAEAQLNPRPLLM